MVYIVEHVTDSLCTKQGNSSIFGLKIRFIIESGFKSRADYDGAHTVRGGSRIWPAAKIGLKNEHLDKHLALLILSGL